MEGFINYILSLGGHVAVNNLDITAVIPNKFSQPELFKIASEIELYNFDADCKFSVSYNEDLSNNEEIVLTGSIHK